MTDKEQDNQKIEKRNNDFSEYVKLKKEFPKQKESHKIIDTIPPPPPKKE
jgi:hypothetical protein